MLAGMWRDRFRSRYGEIGLTIASLLIGADLGRLGFRRLLDQLEYSRSLPFNEVVPDSFFLAKAALLVEYAPHFMLIGAVGLALFVRALRSVTDSSTVLGTFDRWDYLLLAWPLLYFSAFVLTITVLMPFWLLPILVPGFLLLRGLLTGQEKLGVFALGMCLGMGMLLFNVEFYPDFQALVF